MQQLSQFPAQQTDATARSHQLSAPGVPWRDRARLLWPVASALVVALFVVSLPGRYADLLAHPSLSSTASASVLGLAPRNYATYQFTLETCVAIGFFAVAAVMFWRRAHDTAALFVAFTLVAFGAALPGTMDALVSGRPIWAVSFSVLQAIGWLFLLLFAFRFPDARFTPRWTLPFAALAVCWVVAFFALAPALVAPRSWLIASSFAIWVAWFALGVLAQGMRYMRFATHTQRQQTKWVILGFLGGIAGVLLAAIPHILTLTFGQRVAIPAIYQVAATTLATLCALLIPLTIGIAILRHRLYDIDVVINRTLVYGALTASLVLVYAVVVFALQSLAGLLTHQNSSTLAIVASTLLIAALFNPLRRRLQIAIDRRFYRRKYDAALILASFSAALRGDVDLGQVRENLLGVVEKTMRPAHVSLWLREPPEPRDTAAPPPPPAPGSAA